MTEGRSVTVDMAHRFGMEPKNFEAVLRSTVVPANCSAEQFAAFLLVAKQYSLNPITKEIYAFPSRGGGIQPIVGIDGWMRIMNDQAVMDGIEFVDISDDDGQLIAITCKIYRKDRAHPTTVTEYLCECARDTEPWKKWPARMLRHKAAIQCARYAFGFSGIIDPDEYERGVGSNLAPQKAKILNPETGRMIDPNSANQLRKNEVWEPLIAEMRAQETAEKLKNWGTLNANRIINYPDSWRQLFRDEYDRLMTGFGIKPSSVPIKEQLVASLKLTEEEKSVIDDVIPINGGGDEVMRVEEPEPGEFVEVSLSDPDKYLDGLDAQMSGANTEDDLDEIWREHIASAMYETLFPPDRDKAWFLKERHEARLKASSAVKKNPPRKK